MLESIYNYRKITSTLATGGQPDEGELHEIGQAGFEAVINLGLDNEEYSVLNEKDILSLYKIKYFHFPVSFQEPEIEQYRAFSKSMNSVSDKKTFIHCAANKRVSVFVALYQIIEMKLPPQGAQDNIGSIWQPDDVWEKFMSLVLGAANVRNINNNSG